MFSKWTVGRQFFVGVLLVSGLIGAFIFLTRNSTHELLRAADQVVNSQLRLERIDQTFSAIKDAEAWQRDYLLTGNEDSRDTSRQLQLSLPAELETLRTALSNSPEQMRRLDALKGLLDRRLTSLRETLEVRRTQGLDAAVQHLKNGTGPQDMAGIRNLFAEMRQQEEKQYAERTQARVDEIGALDKFFWIDGIALLIFCMLLAVVIGRSLERRLRTAINQVQGSSADLHSAASQQVSGAREQASATTEISITVKELLSTSRQIAGSAQQVARVADDTAGAAQTGKETVQRAQEAIDAVNRQVDAIVTHMLELGKRSQEIGGILDIINELSEQTNILAINATIESAGAGEHGKRFAVVADEIRKLADRVGGATKDIRVLIDEIRAASNTTIMATEDGSKAVQSSARQFSEVAGNFRRIAELVRSNLDVAREIELSTQQQTTAVEQVNTAILEVAQTARQAESTSSQTMQTANQLAQLSQQLNSILDASAKA
ncbi:MAG: methyl-accepting chemotaxis protein [Cystobacter sp.]